jgi:hypothetical protein
MVQRPEEYEYSSHAVYLRGKATEIVNPSKVLELLGGRRRYKRFMLDAMGEGHKEEHYELKDQRFLGASEFVEQVKKEVEEEEDPIPEVSLLKGVELLASAIQIDPGVLQSSDRSWELSRVRTLILYVLTRRFGFRVKDVADHFGRAPETISSSISRFAVHSLRDPTVGNEIERLVDNFNQAICARKTPNC